MCPAIAGLIVPFDHRGEIGGTPVWIVALLPLAVYVSVGITYWVKRNSALEAHRPGPEHEEGPAS